MDIQWMMFAKEYIENKDTTIDINGIFSHLTIGSLVKEAPMLLIAKVKPDISEVGQIKDVIVFVEHIKKGRTQFFRTEYKVHDLATWANFTPYMLLKLKDVKLEHQGEYTFRIFIDKQYKNEESITVNIKGEV
jgi:hypothetical protein